MRGQLYRMKIPAVAIQTQDGRNTPLTIPQDAEIEVVNGPIDGDRLVDVHWGDKTVMMFTMDIRERGERVGADGQ